MIIVSVNSWSAKSQITTLMPSINDGSRLRCDNHSISRLFVSLAIVWSEPNGLLCIDPPSGVTCPWMTLTQVIGWDFDTNSFRNEKSSSIRGVFGHGDWQIYFKLDENRNSQSS